jgi:hypothetical protein
MTENISRLYVVYDHIFHIIIFMKFPVIIVFTLDMKAVFVTLFKQCSYKNGVMC